MKRSESSEASKIPLGGTHDDDDKKNYGTETQHLQNWTGKYFDHNKKIIDFVIVWIELEDTNHKKELRHNFEEALKEAKLILEETVEKQENNSIHYVKIHVPWDIMCANAESLMFKAPLKERVQQLRDNWSADIFKSLHLSNFMDQNVPNMPKNYTSTDFKQSMMQRYLGIDDHDTFFSTTQRQQVAYEILETTAFGKREKGEIGINGLLNRSVYSAAYPPHDGPYAVSKSERDASESMNKRQTLYWYWAQYSLWYKYQPFEHIRQYFGEKIGLYFAWLGHYTAWLVPAALIGLIVFLYGGFTVFSNVEAHEWCNKSKNLRMCPICDEKKGCPYWHLNDACFYIKLVYLFDQPGTIFYSIFTVLWAVFFLEFWKRKNARLAHLWEMTDYEEEEERPRPQFSAICNTFEMNPVTGIKEPFFPRDKRRWRMFTGVSAILIMVAIVIICMIMIIVYRILMEMMWFKNGFLRTYAIPLGNFSAAIVNLIVIIILGYFYQILATKMTNWEMHRTQSEYDTQFTIKVFIFQFFNNYSSIFYVAFFKGRFTGYPGHYNTFLGFRPEECENGNCLIELAILLGTIMIGKQIIGNVQEIGLPWLKSKYRNFKNKFSKTVNKNYVALDEAAGEYVLFKEDNKLLPYEGLFEEYLEMVIQFGFITIFVAAFPLAPLFALLNNWFEIRLDARKLVCQTQRPISERCNNIGIWFSLLNLICKICIITNAFLIGFTSDFIPHTLYKLEHGGSLEGYTEFSLAISPPNTTKLPCRYKAFRDKHGDYTFFYWKVLAARLIFIITFEHLVLFLSFLIDLIIPDVPESLRIKIKREQFLAKQALQKAVAKKKLEIDDSSVTA